MKEPNKRYGTFPKLQENCSSPLSPFLNNPIYLELQQLLFVFQRRGPQRSVDMIVSSSFILGMTLVILMCVQVSQSLWSLPRCNENQNSRLNRVCAYIMNAFSHVMLCRTNLKSLSSKGRNELCSTQMM